MPNRILRESICTSESIDALTPFEETFFYRLIVQCDDYGRLDARAKILKSRLFPLKEDLPLQTVEDTLKVLSRHAMIRLYTVCDLPYLEITTWEKYQKVRTRRKKCPPPPWAEFSDDEEKSE